MASVKMPLANLLNMLVAHPSAIARQERHVSSETSRQSENERKVTRKSVYLTRRAAEVLVETARDEVKSESHVVNSALIFYAERGAYMEELIRQSVKEAFREFNPATTRRRVLIKSRSVNGST